MNIFTPLAAVLASATFLAVPVTAAERDRPVPSPFPSTDIQTVRQIEEADRVVRSLRPVYVEPNDVNTRWYVEFNDGSAYRFRPCKSDDSVGCFWNADVRGNEFGYSFINLDGHTYRLWRKAGK